MSSRDFPESFLWGAATSAHQVEGGNTNDWSKWEEAGNVRNQELSGQAADHWNRYEEDFDLLEELHLDAYRFSIEWSRIEPEKGNYDQEAIEHYRRMLESLTKRGIEPVVTLHHFTNPLWLEDWTERENVGHFIDYVSHVVAELGPLVKYWCTINEPVNVALLAYAGDIWPPQKNNAAAGYRALQNFSRAHRQAYDKIHSIYQQKDWGLPVVGIPLTLPYFTPANNNPLNTLAAKIVRRFRNHYFLRRVSDKLDFIGVNYYFTFHVRWNSIKSFTWVDNQDLQLPKNDLGWNIEPEGLEAVLKDVYRRYQLPIMITENGIPDEEDKLRRWYIVSHLHSVRSAMRHGVHVIGYMHWSLMDNFEWADGYHGRFGLIHVDFDTQTRTIRNSARTYSEIAKTNVLPPVEERHQ